MEIHIPSYYEKFHCLADACPHTCCAWWEVPVDDASAAFYRSVPGELGHRLRAALVPDEAGQACFRLTGGQCPFLDGLGLCSLQLKWGEEGIPAICREHPRFRYDYGSVAELGLCASCPECARLVLEEDFTLTLTHDGQPGQDADPLLEPLLLSRSAALELLGVDAPLTLRLRGMLLLANDVQNALDQGAPGAIGEVCALYAGSLPRVDDAVLPPREEALAAVLRTLQTLEPLQGEWTWLLEGALDRLARREVLPAPPQTAGSRATGYFLYRHWLRGLNDGDVLSWAQLAAVGVAVAGALSGLAGEGFAGAFRMFCLEVEHSQDNLDALQDALWHTLTLPQLLALA